MADASARKKLRSAVRGAWDTEPELKSIQDQLTKKGFEIASPHFIKCITEGTKSLKECYKEVGDQLSSAYRSIWGAK